MPRPKSDLLVRGVLLRDVAALKRRVQALEKAIWPSAPTPPRRKPSKRQLVELDEKAARRAAIEAFYQADRNQWLRENPRILERLRADRERLNKYLREHGFHPEPESED